MVNEVIFNSVNGEVVRRTDDDLVIFTPWNAGLLTYWQSYIDKTSGFWQYAPGSNTTSNPHIWYENDHNGTSGPSNGALLPTNPYPFPTSSWPDNFASFRAYPLDDYTVYTTRAIYGISQANHGLDTGDFSIFFWFKACDTTYYAPANWSTYHTWPYNVGYFGLGPYNSSTKKNNFNFWTIAGDYVLSHNGGETTVASGTLTNGTWYHLGIVKSGSNLKIYLNNTLTHNIATTNPDNDKIFIMNFQNESDLFAPTGSGDWEAQTYNFIGTGGWQTGDPKSSMSGIYIYNVGVGEDVRNYLYNNT